MPTSHHRKRCYRCFRPETLCFCEAIPQIDNRTDVLLLQHVGERYHPFNTARIVKESLNRCELFVDHNSRLSGHGFPIAADAGLLYPQADAPRLSELSPEQRPSQMVIIDGTWNQAKTILRDVPELHALPCYRLDPETPGQYRIRREPNAFSLSTLEATVSALKALEPETTGLDQLLAAFHKMVDDQLELPVGRNAWRKKKSRGKTPRYVPPALLGDANSLVVAYGEATPGAKGKRSTSVPVNWFAERLGNGERFEVLLPSVTELSAEALGHMRLNSTDFNQAISNEQFRNDWAGFLKPRDVLVVYHDRTRTLLKHFDAEMPPGLVLKSIFGSWQTKFRTLEELLRLEGVEPPPVDGVRAHERLAMAVRLVKALRKRLGSSNTAESKGSTLTPETNRIS